MFAARSCMPRFRTAASSPADADHRDLARELLARARDDELAAQALLRVGEVSDVIEFAIEARSWAASLV